MENKCLTSRVAGVTFDNEVEDGGRNRQEILAELFQAHRQSNNTSAIITVNLKHTTFRNKQTGIIEPAIKCVEKESKQVIGWIPREDIAKMKGIRQLTGFIKFIRDGYAVELDEQSAPTSAQYKAVKTYCDRNRKPMPAYDARAYGIIFAEMRTN